MGKDCNEKKSVSFISISKKFNWLKVLKQPVVGDRFNIVAYDSKPTKLLLTAHIDTVQTRDGWKTNPFKPTITNQKLYGWVNRHER